MEEYNGITKFNTTGSCEIDTSFFITNWSSEYFISKWNDEYTIIKENEMKVRISEDDALTLIKNLYLEEEKSDIFRSGSSFRAKSEYILCAAIWYNDGVTTNEHQPKNIETGFVVCGRRHHNCIATISILVKDFKRDVRVREIQGFLTNTNRFVDRKEALEIAINSGQVKERGNRTTLFSEDLW